MKPSVSVTVADTFHYSCIGLQEIIRRKSAIRPFSATGISEIFRLIENEKTKWVILTDEFRGSFGIDSITTIHNKYSSVKICILTAINDIHHLRHLLTLQVKALIHKSTRGHEIKTAILHHPANEIYCCPVISKLLFDHKQSLAHKKILSGRQIEIIKLIIAGKTTQQIAIELEIRESSIATQRKRINEKKRRYGFKNLIDLARADGIII